MKITNNTIKLTFTGDILCSMSQNELCYVNNGYDYSKVFENVEEELSSSDFVCGNLETTISGKELEYTNSAYSFNTPIEFLDALKKAGFDMLTLANNHILDRGELGVINTIQSLENRRIEYTGIYRSKQDCDNIYIREIKGCRIAIISTTYGVNSEIHGLFIPSEKDYMIDYLREQAMTLNWQFSWNMSLIGRGIRKIKKICSRFFCYEYYNPNIVIDTATLDSANSLLSKKYEQRVLDKIRKAKEIADIVIVCLHVGGQYNSKLGEYTKYIYTLLENEGIDMIVGNHPHVVLPHRKKHESLITYSLGNFAFTPDENVIKGVYADYSILLNAYVSVDEKAIVRYSFSIVKNVVEETGLSQPIMLYDLYSNEKDKFKKEQLLQDCKCVLKRFGWRGDKSLQKEYYID